MVIRLSGRLLNVSGSFLFRFFSMLVLIFDSAFQISIFSLGAYQCCIFVINTAVLIAVSCIEGKIALNE